LLPFGPTRGYARGARFQAKYNPATLRQPMMRTILLVIAAASTPWSLAVWLIGGFTVALGGIELASRDPFGPSWPPPWQRWPISSPPARPCASGFRPVLPTFDAARGPAGSLPGGGGLAMNGWTAAGADSYAYVRRRTCGSRAA
jgi:hypothetical protein